MIPVFLIAFVHAAAVFAADSPNGSLTPAESMASIQVDEKLRVELVACEPEVFDPVALCFDESGRMYVVENRGYPTGPGPGKPPAGSIALLEDADNDGRYEKRTTFATELEFPNGIMAWQRGVLVTDAPHIYFLSDTDHDNRADVRDVVLTGFAEGGSTQLRVSHPTLGLDNWIYVTNGLSGGKVSSPSNPSQNVVDMGGLDLRWHSLRGALETTAGQAQFGLTFDDFGNKFVCSNRKHIELVMLQPNDLSRNPYLTLSRTVSEIPDHGEAAPIFPLSENKTTAYSHIGTFTAACGLHVYRGDALPPEYYGNAFVCDPTGNLIHRDVLEPQGPGLVAKRAAADREFFATTDNWSRPVFVTSGPDGALYVCDMYRKSIEHPTYLPPELAAETDFESGKECGRIYRITSAKHSRRSHARNDWLQLSIKRLVDRLTDPNAWVRDCAHRHLLHRNDRNAGPALEKLVASENAAYARVTALYLLDTLGVLRDETLKRSMDDKSAHVRAHAVRLTRERIRNTPGLLDDVLSRAADTDTRVRFETALALGDAQSERTLPALGSILARDIDDSWMQAAVLSSIFPYFAAFVRSFVAEVEPPPPLSRLLGQMVARGESQELITASLRQVLPAGGASLSSWQTSFLLGVCEARDNSRELLTNVSDASLSNDVQAMVQTSIVAATERVAATESLLNAIELLGYCSYETSGRALLDVINSSNSDELRVAAVQSISRMDKVDVGRLLSEPGLWATFTPAVRAAALSALVRSPDRTPYLIAGLEQGVIPRWFLDASQRATLENHGDESIRDRAKAIFGVNSETSRATAYADAKQALFLTGNPDAGKVVFSNLCGNCHIYQGIGNSVGPDLSDIRAQPAEAILKHIIDPNSEVTKGFEAYTVETMDGESLSGILVKSLESRITIRQALGIEHVVPRADIVRIDASQLSLMPEDLEKGMKPQELCDLIGFLKR